MGARRSAGLLIGTLVLLLGGAGVLIRSHACCRECGLYRKTRTVFGLAIRTHEPTPVPVRRELNDPRESRRDDAAKATEYVDPAWSDDGAHAGGAYAQAWRTAPADSRGAFEVFRRARGR